VIQCNSDAEKCGVKSKKPYFRFVDLEATFDSLPRQVMRWAMRKLGVDEWLISAVMSVNSVQQQ